MVYDTFAKEMVLEPTGIVKAKKPERKDTYEGMKRVELHLHTNMSAMDGMSSTASLLCRAAKWGHRAMAITDTVWRRRSRKRCTRRRASRRTSLVT